MSRDLLLEKTIDNLKRLPDQNLREVSDFTEFLLKRIEDRLITHGIQKLASESKTFKFLEEEPDIYSVNDLQERYR
jgi:hypothetical protein